MTPTPSLHLDVAILGGGFAGVAAAQVLAREARRSAGFRVGLIASENYMVFQPMLAEVAGGSLSPRHVINPIRQLCRGIEVFRGEIKAVDPQHRLIRLNAGGFTPDVWIGYRELVVCLGAKVDLSRVPGMPEHALLMQNVGDAMKLRTTVISRFEEANLVADQALRRRLLSFVVVGGGYSGVETAGELLDLMAEMVRFYGRVRPDDFAVHLVHSGERLLPTLSPKLGDYCREKLAARGMHIRLERRVKAVTAQSVLLDDGTVLESSTVVSTVGNAPHPVVQTLARDFGVDCPRGRLRVEADLSVSRAEGLWAAGDCAAVPLPGGAGECPATAQFAQRQGELLARNLLARRKGQALRTFAFKGLGEMAAIGHRSAVAKVFGLQFSGFAAWWLWRSVYLMKLPGLQRKLRVMADWTFDLFFPRDINLLSPQYTRKVRQVHLEPGDVLFKPGEPAFSLYFLKEGRVDIMDGTYQVRTILAGDYFGEKTLLGDGIYRYAAVAREPCTLVALGSEEFRALVDNSRTLQRLFERSSQVYASKQEVEALKGKLSPEALARPVATWMNRQMDCLRPETPLREAMQLFQQRRHGSYPVVDARGHLLGMVKRDDLYDALKREDIPADATIKRLPFSDLPTTHGEATAAELIELFLRSGRNKVLVLDGEQRLCGIVTLADLLALAM